MAVQIYGEKIFALQTEKSTYVMEKDSHGLLRHLYWGRKVEAIGDFEGIPEEGSNGYHPYVDRIMEEYAPFGDMRYKETALKLEYEDGTKDFRYRLEGWETVENGLELFLQEETYPCRVTLHYRVFEKEDIIKRWVTVQNMGEEDIVLERCMSAQFGIAGTGYRSINFNGGWGKEFFRQEDTVLAGKKVYESLRGCTAHVANPCFILHRDADEEKGEVYFGLLAYSGNFKVTVEATPYEWTNVLIGMSDTDFSWVLRAGEALETPAVFAGFTDGGLGGMSAKLHCMEQKELMPAYYANKTLRVLYNSWYATYFDVQCGEQKKLADRAADIGVELFVVDDGWFFGRRDDRRALGDWTPDPVKFPAGLTELIDHVKGLGMEFGLWVEPEMVNEESGLYQEHPEWVYRFENREIRKGRNQYVLDLTRQDVAAYLIEMLDRLLTDYDISYLKWDLNRAIGETGISGKTAAERKMMWHSHVKQFYRIVEAIRKRHPKVELEACAGGGGRVDCGAMLLFDEYWISDNTDPVDRLCIQESCSLLYPAKYMRAWVTDSPDGLTGRSVPLSFALHAAMCTSLGIGKNLNTMGEPERKLLKEQIAVYKNIREEVQLGSLYRLNSFERDGYGAVQYQKDGRNVAFAFLVQGRYGKAAYRIRLRNLREEGKYRVNLQGREFVKSGAFLMRYGIEIRLTGDYDSCMILAAECG